MFEDNVKLLHSFKNGNNKISRLFFTKIPLVSGQRMN